MGTLKLISSPLEDNIDYRQVKEYKNRFMKSENIFDEPPKRGDYVILYRSKHIENIDCIVFKKRYVDQECYSFIVLEDYDSWKQLIDDIEIEFIQIDTEDDDLFDEKTISYEEWLDEQEESEWYDDESR